MSENPFKLDYWFKIVRLVFICILIIIGGHYFEILANRAEHKSDIVKENVENYNQGTAAFWNTKNKLSLKEDMMGRNDLQVLKVKVRSEFCDCLIRKLENAYPDGGAKTSDTAKVNEMNVECLDSLTFRSAQKLDGTTIFKDLKKK